MLGGAGVSLVAFYNRSGGPDCGTWFSQIRVQVTQDHPGIHTVGHIWNSYQI